MRRFIVFSVLLLLAGFVSAQDDSGKIPPKDTLPRVDSPVIIKTDSVPKRKPIVHRDSSSVVKKDAVPVVDSTTLAVIDSSASPLSADSVSRKPYAHATWEIDPRLPLSYQLMLHHPYFAFASKPVVVRSDLKLFKGKESLFYALIGLLLTFSFMRQAFPKYFNDLFRLLFRTTIKQKQISEQLMQTPLPSLLLNVLFVFTAGMYIDLLLQHYGHTPVDNFWLLSLYCSLGLTIMYVVKFFD